MNRENQKALRWLLIAVCCVFVLGCILNHLARKTLAAALAYEPKVEAATITQRPGTFRAYEGEVELLSSSVVEAPAQEQPEVCEEYPEDFENQKIETALTEQGYIREDIPLDNETQILLRAACDEFGVEYELALAVIWKETTFRNIMGDEGKAYGYFQVWPRWHSDRMAKLGVTDLNDPYSNFRVGLDYLSELIDAYDGNVEMALMAYNAGITGANKHWFSKGIYSNDYSKAVLSKYADLLSGA